MLSIWEKTISDHSEKAQESNILKGNPEKACLDKLNSNGHILHLNFGKCQIKAKTELVRKYLS